MRRLLTAVAFVFATATALPAVTATSAHADFDACVSHLAENGYDSPEAVAACETGAEGNLELCIQAAYEAGVDPYIALEACVLAHLPVE
ncbi:hypothetical protein E1265_13825 [Streptomyces sp. 8K308]|uniref:hypothetical protein n=1 Tax=Streptomyces sp. 8K308 TaxID=2530388 RepID=UPI001053F441|nr:hypothetical protein [Streptomyces sp. 8K308]TDC23106.1 hypothetical protein E1265_13825 [Streptomyces sp. 8K308]